MPSHRRRQKVLIICGGRKTALDEVETIIQCGFLYDIAQSPWTDDGRIYASRRLGMSDANKKSSAGDAKQRVKHEIFASDAASAQHAGSARAI